MDYTKLPRILIYKDRKDIDDFPVNGKVDYQFMEEAFLKLLEQRPFVKESYDAPEFILQIFNNARYITTLICLEKHPNHYLRKYLEIAGGCDYNYTISNHVVPATMALVINYLCLYMPTLYNGSQIVKDITENFNTITWKEASNGGQDDFNKLIIENTGWPSGWLSDPNFKPRDIRQMVNDPNFTAYDISENIDYIMESLEKSVSIPDEEIEPLNVMYKKVEAWFPQDVDCNVHKEIALGQIDSRLKKLDPNNAFEFFNLMNETEKSLYYGQEIPPETKDKMSKYLKKTIGLDFDEIEAATSSLQEDSENESLKSQIVILKAKIESLNKQLQECNDKDIDEIFSENSNQQNSCDTTQEDNSGLQKRIAELEQEVERLTDENSNYKEQPASYDFADEGGEEKLTGEEIITLRERLVFFFSVLSLDNNKKYTVLSNLATFISVLCNDQKNVVSFISRMKKPEEAAANAKAAKKVAGLMKVIIPTAYRNDEKLKINKLINSMLLNFPDKEE